MLPSKFKFTGEIFMNTASKYLAACVAAAGLAFSGSVFADREDARRLSETKISLTEAIAIAEKHQGGQAYEASLDADSRGLHYEVDVVVGDKRYEVKVDGVSGDVTKVKEDRD
jgi:uncharacterized membrane protein YkoI